MYDLYESSFYARFDADFRVVAASPPRRYRRTVLRDRPVERLSDRMLSPCFFKTTNSICSSAFSIGPSNQEEPPNAVGQIHVATRVSFALPVTQLQFRQHVDEAFVGGQHQNDPPASAS